MKLKALRYKDTKEFVHILEDGSLVTGSMPDVHPTTATIDVLKQYYNDVWGDKIQPDFANLEIVEFDFIESDVTGEDIRNKLSSPLNLVALLKVYFEDNVDKETLKKYILREMSQTTSSIEYLSKLL